MLIGRKFIYWCFFNLFIFILFMPLFPPFPKTVCPFFPFTLFSVSLFSCGPFFLCPFFSWIGCGCIKSKAIIKLLDSLLSRWMKVCKIRKIANTFDCAWYCRNLDKKKDMEQNTWKTSMKTLVNRCGCFKHREMSK